MLVLLEIVGGILLVTFVVGAFVGSALSSAAQSRKLQRWRAKEEGKFTQRARELQKMERRLEKLSHELQPRKSRRQLLPLTQSRPPQSPAAEPMRQPHQTAFAISPPTDDFTFVCECPCCGSLDAHSFRVAIHPAPSAPAPSPEIKAERAWCNRVVGWFADDKKTDVAMSETQPPNSEDFETTAEKPWWNPLGWFDDDSKQCGDAGTRADRPVGDHPDAQVVRTCEQCGHAWAQR